MNFSRAFLIRFYAPLLCAVIIALLAVLDISALAMPLTGETEFSYWNFSIKIPISFWKENPSLTRVSLFLFSVVLFFYAISVDFSKFFPTVLRLDVFYDVDGVEEIVSRLNDEEVAALQIDDQWKSKISEYDEDVVTHIRQLWKRQGLPDAWPKVGTPRPHFTGAGETSFIVARTGFLSYRITEAKGKLLYSVQTPRDGWRTFPGLSQLKSTLSSHIRPKFPDILKRGYVLIRPEFAQTFGTGSVHETSGINEHDHTLIAVTRITLFPLPSVGDTVYLWRGRSGLNIPIARSVYH